MATVGKVYRDKWDFVTSAGALIASLFLVVDSWRGEIAFIDQPLLWLALAVVNALSLRKRVRTDEEGVSVHNLFRSYTVPWSQIERFSLAPREHRIQKQGVVHADGREGLWMTVIRKPEQVDELNALLRQTRGTG